MRARVTLEEKSWIFDEDELTNDEAKLIKGATGGLGLVPFFAGLRDLDPDCMQALVWFLRRKDGEPVRLEEINFKVTALRMVEEPDPTQPSGSES